MIGFRCYRVGRSLVTLQRTPSLPSLSQRKRSDENGITYGNVYRVSIQIPDSFDSMPKETRILLRSNKIGFVRGETMEDVRKRVRALQTGTPFLLTLEKVYRCPTPDIYEKYFHQVFKSQRGIGEWFDLSEKNKCEMNSIMEELDRSGKFIGDATLLESIQFEKEKRSHGSTENESEYREVPLYEQLRTILNGHRLDLQNKSIVSSRRYLSNKDKTLVMTALQNHPKHSEKIGCGVVSIFVKEIYYEKMYSYCFHVKRVDGSEEQFNYHACFGFWQPCVSDHDADIDSSDLPEAKTILPPWKEKKLHNKFDGIHYPSTQSAEKEYELSNLVLGQDETNRTNFGDDTITRQLESIDQYNTANIIKTKHEVSRILRGHRIKLEEKSHISTRRRYVSHKDKAVVMSALVNHPNASEIIGCGVDKIFVKYNTRLVKFDIRTKDYHNGKFSYCFHVKRVDGSEESFNYLACFDGGKIWEERSIPKRILAQFTVWDSAVSYDQ